MSREANILIVDDNTDNIKIVSGYLKEVDYNLALALSGEEALAIMKENPIDLVLLDIMMPGMDGYEVARRMKDDEALKNIPIIFLTARDDTHSIIKGFALGAADYINKPVNKQELQVRVNHHVSLSKAYKTIEEKNNELKEAVTSRDTIYAIIAHDIRGPFLEIMSFIELLSKGHITPNDKNFIEFTSALSTKTHLTYNLLNNLLRWSALQLNRIKINKKTFCLKEEFEESLSLFAIPVGDKKIIVKKKYAEDELPLFADQNMISTIVRNLLSNAIKFTPKGGEIAIRLFKNKEKQICFEIKDSGIGMPKEIIQSILCGTSNTSTRGTDNEKGVGLGLQLVFHFLTMHNAILDIKSDLGKGSTFNISMPAE